MAKDHDTILVPRRIQPDEVFGRDNRFAEGTALTLTAPVAAVGTAWSGRAPVRRRNPRLLSSRRRG